MTSDSYKKAADALLKAHRTGNFISPLRDAIGNEPEAGYAVQAINTARWVEEGRRIVGRKIGLTSLAVQRQLGVDQPDFGVLFADMEFGDGDELPFERMQQPRAEAEIALVMGRDTENPDVTYAELVKSVDCVLPAIEIVGSRIKDWDIKISDTIADNASSGLYVLGGPMRKLEGVDLVNAGMVMSCNGRPVSFGAGVACLGSPLNAALWLARKSASLGTPLKEGDVILTGALGPMAPVARGDVFEARIESIGSVRFSVDAK
ncbi:2-keto-4-pentenoate hydratase [Hyphomonas sp.]|uniref:2-keto-4-pentenoate hydratase n=1 Tax=Hyphomonas sp. TaxID=87 RepID=UPI003528795C